MGFNFGVVRAALRGMGGDVIASAARTKAGASMVSPYLRGMGRFNATRSLLRSGNPAVAAAAKGMMRSGAIRGALQGAAIMGGGAAALQMGSNISNGRSAMSGVGSAAFRGGLAGGLGGAAIGTARSFAGANSGSWSAFMKSKAMANEIGGVERSVAGFARRGNIRLNALMEERMGGSYTMSAARRGANWMKTNGRGLAQEKFNGAMDYLAAAQDKLAAMQSGMKA